MKKIPLPKRTCKQCGKKFVIVQPNFEIQLGIPAQAPVTCKEHE